MADRVILHCDCNGFFASVEMLSRPELAGVPMAVAGDPESRHGIILAKNELAKGYGVKTAETIWQAKKKCPGLVLVPPHHQRYHEISRRVNQIYLDYTDLVDPFGIDESFLDVTGSMHLFPFTPRELADVIRARVRSEIGITISVGVSCCRVFAQLGSDYKKPDATTVIDRENFKEIVYPLPVSDMLFVGRRTAEQLRALGVLTVGDLAAADPVRLTALLGEAGGTLWRYANGNDHEPVGSYYARKRPKSVGNGMTFRRNIVGEGEIRAGAAAAEYALGKRIGGRVIDVKTQPGVNYTVPQKIRPDNVEKSVDIFFRTNKVRGNSVIRVTSGETKIAEFKREHMAPGEMEKITIPKVLLDRCSDSIEIVVEDA